MYTRLLKSLVIVLAMGLFATGACAESVETEWWNDPYPNRFDPATLEIDQAFLSVNGDRLVTGDGAEIILRGVNIADPDKLAQQGHWNRELFAEIRGWGANVVRLPVHPVAWRNRGDRWYFDRIDEAVRWSNALGMYLILDWHSIGNLKTGLFQHPMYATSPVETANFWKSVAHRYQGVPTLAVYELFNEPTDDYIGAGSGSLGAVSWAEWRDIQESLIDLIRVYDPSVVPLVTGFNWAYDLSHVSDQPIRRNGVAYAIHPYPQKAKPEENTQAAFFELWQEQWGRLSDEYPLIATELGWVAENGPGAHVPVINNDGSYGPNLVTFLEERHVSWTVWSFDPDWSPTLISDWSYTPTEQGRFFRNVLLLAENGPIPHSILPSPRVTEYPWMSISTWQAMHAEDVAIAESGDVSLLFLGDSITEGWPDSVWNPHFGAYRPANFGIGGDMTGNVLWRLQNGAVGRLKPDVVVLMIGVNNFGLATDSPDDVARGVRAIVGLLETSFQNAKIVLLGILPHGEQPGTPERRQVTETNALLAKFGEEDPSVDFYDIGQAFLEKDGSISPEIMADFLHPTEAGYVIFAEQLDPVIKGLYE